MQITKASKSAKIILGEGFELDVHKVAKFDYRASEKSGASIISRGHNVLSKWAKRNGFEPQKIVNEKGVRVNTYEFPVIVKFWKYQAKNNNGRADFLIDCLLEETLKTRASEVLGDNLPSTADIEIQIETAKNIALWEAQRDFNASVQGYYNDTTGNRSGHIHNAIYVALFGMKKAGLIEKRAQVESEKWNRPEIGLNHIEDPEDVKMVVMVKQEIMAILHQRLKDGAEKISEKALVELAIENLMNKGKI